MNRVVFLIVMELDKTLFIMRGLRGKDYYEFCEDEKQRFTNDEK